MAVVVALFEKRLQGLGVRELAVWTREIGVTSNIHHPRTLGQGLSHVQICRILSNDFYVTGELSLKVTQPGWSVEVIRQRIELPRYVDPEVFNQVAAMRKRRYGERQAAGLYLLGGLVYHRTSGTPFTSSSTKTASGRYRYYTNPEWAAAQRRLQVQWEAVACIQRRRSPPIRASLRKEELEGVVLAQLARAAEDPRLLRRMLGVDRDREAAERTAYVRNQKELRQAEAAADRLLEAFASGVLHMTEAPTREYREIASHVARLTIDEGRLKVSLALPRGREREAQVQEALRRLSEQLREATPDQRRILVAGLIYRVWIEDDGRVYVHLRGTDPYLWRSGCGRG